MPKQVRRKVVSGHKTGVSLWSNYYHVTLSCGHKATAQGYKGTMPKTSSCPRCQIEAMHAEAARLDADRVDAASQ